MTKNISKIVKPVLLPLCIAIYPALFHYGNNARLLVLQSLVRAMLLYIVIAVIVYMALWLLAKQTFEAANASFVFLIFFHLYGVVMDYSLKLDVFQVEHYMLLPFTILLACYVSWAVLKMKPLQSVRFWKNSLFVMSVLLIFNIAKIGFLEIRKLEKRTAVSEETVASNLSTQNSPDIYYIIFDELSGFEPMRKYWHNRKVDGFVDFLGSNGFFIAENSRSSSLVSLHQMATRLNYQEFPCCEYEKYIEIYYENVSDNKVMRYLKSKGYSTVVFEELTIPGAFPAMHPISANYSFADVSKANISTVGSSGLFDEFGKLVADYSMLRAFPIPYENGYSGHRDKILYIVNTLGNLKEVSSPKFIYVHLLLPHLPFMFDENGNVIDVKYHGNWNYYLGTYNYSLEVAKKIVENILANADPDRPPVIILQSDHGARNIYYGSAMLSNYPEEYKTQIVFALRLPGYDTSTLPQDINPINTFPIIFNYLFDDNIPLK
ncbi:MAG: hypothetical protein HZB18_16690 [Chloroflexi bacterium]|nr:hypothetical protein [Chloroflexota bacterium]